MTARLLITALFIFSCTTQLRAESKLSLTRSNEPIQIKSDQLVADNNKKSATFSGNVAARQGDLTIYSDKMIINYSSEAGDISTVEVWGKVKVLQGERRAESDHALYDSKKGTIMLDGSPKVFQHNDTISGRLITYYLDEEKSEVTSGEKSRVEAVIHPKGRESVAKPAKP